MAANASKRGEARARAGAWALSLLATVPNPVVLETLAARPSSLVELQATAGVPGSTLRTRLRGLNDAGAIVAHRGNGFRRAAAEYELTDSGRDLLTVAATLERWLEESPKSGRAFGGSFPKAAIVALVEGWSATLLRALAAKPLSIAELDSLIAGLNYPSLERRIAAMRNAGLVEARRSTGRETPYAVTTWLRRGVAPLLAAVRWEREHLREGGAPATGLDVEAALLLTMPLLRLDPELRGSCRLSVEFPTNGVRPVAGVRAVIGEGGVRSCSSKLQGDAEAWASGTLAAMLRAMTEGDETSLELGGDGGLARTLIRALHRTLFISAPLEDLGEAALQRG